MNGRLRRLKRWDKGNEAPPYSVVLVPTNYCNLRCRMCGTQIRWREEGDNAAKIFKRDENKELSFEKIFRLINDAEKMCVEWVSITGGGEPFFRKEKSMKILRSIKGAGLHGDAITNGTMFKKDDVRNIVALDWDNLTFSIDAPRAEVHDNLRNAPGTFKRATKNLLRFKKIKSEMNSKKPGIAINTVLTELNYSYLPEMAIFADIMNCFRIDLKPLRHNQYLQNLEISDTKKLLKAIEKFTELADRFGIKNNAKDVRREFEERKNDEKEKNKKEGVALFSDIHCFKPFLKIFVRMDGEVAPCCLMEKSAGNIKNQHLEEIWRGEYFRNLREKFIKNEIPEACSDCELPKNMYSDLRKGLEKDVL